MGGEMTFFRLRDVSQQTDDSIYLCFHDHHVVSPCEHPKCQEQLKSIYSSWSTLPMTVLGMMFAKMAHARQIRIQKPINYKGFLMILFASLIIISSALLILYILKDNATKMVRID